MAIYDIKGNQIVAEGGSVIGAITPEQTTFLEKKINFTSLLNGVGFHVALADDASHVFPMSNVVLDVDFTFEAGTTYYLYIPFSTTASNSVDIWKNDGTGNYASHLSYTSRKTVFGLGTYNEYNIENTATYQPDGVNYLHEFVFTPTETFSGRFRATNKCVAHTLPQYVYLFTEPYNPYKDTIEGGFFFTEEYAEGFVQEFFKEDSVVESFKDNADEILPDYATQNAHGKHWWHIGDSNSAWYGGSVMDSPDDMGFLVQAARKNGISKLTNRSMAGASWAYRADYEDSLNAQSGIARVEELLASGETPDIITIMLGTNSDDAIGTMNDAVTNKYTTYSAVKYCMEFLLQAFPTSAIGVMLPMQRAEGNTQQAEKNNAIKEVCEYYAIPTLDLYHTGQIVPDSKLTAYDDGHEGIKYTDAAHVTTYGRNHIARKLTAWLNSI